MRRPGEDENRARGQRFGTKTGPKNGGRFSNENLGRRKGEQIKSSLRDTFRGQKTATFFVQKWRPTFAQKRGQGSYENAAQGSPKRGREACSKKQSWEGSFRPPSTRTLGGGGFSCFSASVTLDMVLSLLEVLPWERRQRLGHVRPVTWSILGTASGLWFPSNWSTLPALVLQAQAAKRAARGITANRHARR